MQQNEIKSLSLTLHKTQLKMDQGPRNQTRDPGPNHQHVDLGSDFLNRTPIAQEIKARINNWDRFKLKSFLSAKETIGNVKREPREWE